MDGVCKSISQRDTYNFAGEATVVAIRVDAKTPSSFIVLLDETVFYPQGGGQPSDVGTIKPLDDAAGATLHVRMVKEDGESGNVEHQCTFASSQPDATLEDVMRAFPCGSKVRVAIDGKLRILHSRIHSAGHLLDHIAEQRGWPLVGVKGYHFTAGPYIEYAIKAPSQEASATEGEGRATGDVSKVLDTSPQGLAKLKAEMQADADELLKKGGRIRTVAYAPEDLPESVRKNLGPKAAAASSVRLIHFEGSPEGQPCGGTHVSTLEEIASMTIKKVSLRPENVIRVGYSIGC